MLGHDTEYFAFDTKTNKPVPAHKLGIPPKEEAKEEKSEWGRCNGKYFRDGYAIELNSDPVTCRAHIWNAQSRILRALREKLPKNIELITDPCVKIDLADIRKGPDDVRTLGCNPTYDPYARKINEIDVNPLELTFRTSGAHLHMGVETDNLDELAILAKYSDLLIGLPFTVIFGDDLEFQRRTLYGRAGEFRPQLYNSKRQRGFEYRSLSSRLYNHPAIYSLFLGIWKYVMSYGWKKLIEGGWNDKLNEPLQKAINTGSGAEDLLAEFAKHLKLPTINRNPSYSLDFEYVPKDWGAAILALKQKRKEGEFDTFHLWKGTCTDGHWGWYEANTGKERWSTVGARFAGQPKEPWKL